MIKLRTLLFPALLTLAACGGKEPGPMAGNWTHDNGIDAAGMVITFDGNSNKISVHLPTRPDGGHGHAKGDNTYTYDDESKALTVNSELLGPGKPTTWTGTVAGDGFELSADDAKLKFTKGGTVAGH